MNSGRGYNYYNKANMTSKHAQVMHYSVKCLIDATIDRALSSGALTWRLSMTSLLIQHRYETKLFQFGFLSVRFANVLITV